MNFVFYEIFICSRFTEDSQPPIYFENFVQAVLYFDKLKPDESENIIILSKIEIDLNNVHTFLEFLNQEKHKTELQVKFWKERE